jgi:hypothetical protein
MKRNLAQSPSFFFFQLKIKVSLQETVLVRTSSRYVYRID